MYKKIILIVFVFAALSFAAYGVTKISEAIQVADGISLEEVKDCKTVYWNETENTYGNCIRYYNITFCEDDPLNTSCYIQEKSYNYTCLTDTKTVEKNKEICRDKEFQFTIDKPLKVETYKLEYGDWGMCTYMPGDEVLTITCDSRYDGNNDGICTSGESCILFIVTKNRVDRYVKNSRDDFVIHDESFFLPKLNAEVVK